jgi:hypothetical protein
MSTLVMTSAATHRAWGDTALGSFLLRFRSGVREGQAIAARYDCLSRMSDGQLAQHGLTRRDINRAALNGF